MTPLCSFFRTSNEGLKMTRAFSSVYCNACFWGGLSFLGFFFAALVLICNDAHTVFIKH